MTGSDKEDAEEDGSEQGRAAGARLVSPQPQAESEATGASMTICGLAKTATQAVRFFDCGWALFGNRVAGKRPRGSQCILNTG